VGIPLRVVIGERGVKEGTIEIKWRSEGTARNLPLAGAAEGILAELNEAKARLAAVCREKIASRAGARPA
jgi:prolyl-tRNA synthetase